MNGTISVIVPVYNVEKYLSECIESIIHQTYEDLEIILIDDESPDNCGCICDNYAKKDSRIKVIHKKNGGAASARNEGLKIATGEYLSFVDSDDYLELDAYQNMVELMKQYDSDVVQCSFRNVYRNSKKDVRSFDDVQTFSTQEYLVRYTNDWTCGMACDKLVKRSLFQDIFYETGHLIDDEFFTYQGVMNAQKIVYSPKVVYNYRKRKSSVMLNSTGREKMLSDRLAYLSKRRKLVVNRFPELKNTFDYHYLESLVYLSRESALTLEIADLIKRSVIRYFISNKPCKLSVYLIRELIVLFFSKSSSLVNNRKSNSDSISDFLYFD